MSATVIDTLRFADRLKEAGFEGPQAEGMARALGDELAERMLTRRDLQEALRPIHARFDAMESKFDARLDVVDARLDGMDSKFNAVDSKFDAMDSRFDAMEDQFDVKFDALRAEIGSVHRELSGKFNVLVGVMALGFTLLAGLGSYNAVVPRFGPSTMEPSETLQEETKLPVAPSSRPLAEG